MQQNGVFRTDVDAGGFLSCLQVGDADVALERLVRQVEANRFGKEVLERNLVDALGAGLLVKMDRRVDMVPEWSPMFSEITADEKV